MQMLCMKWISMIYPLLGVAWSELSIKAEGHLHRILLLEGQNRRSFIRSGIDDFISAIRTRSLAEERY